MRVDANAAVDAVYRSDWGRIVATLIRLVRDFDVAEEAAQEAFTAAVDQWRGSRGPPVPPPRVIQTAPPKALHPTPPPAPLAGKPGALPPARGGPTRQAPPLHPGRTPPDRPPPLLPSCH